MVRRNSAVKDSALDLRRSPFHGNPTISVANNGVVFREIALGFAQALYGSESHRLGRFTKAGQRQGWQSGGFLGGAAVTDHDLGALLARTTNVVVAGLPDVARTPGWCVAGSIQERHQFVARRRQVQDRDRSPVHVEGRHEAPHQQTGHPASEIVSIVFQVFHARVGQNGHLEIGGPAQVVYHNTELVALLEQGDNDPLIVRSSVVTDGVDHLFRHFVGRQQGRLFHSGFAVDSQSDLDCGVVQPVVDGLRSRYGHGIKGHAQGSHPPVDLVHDGHDVFEALSGHGSRTGDLVHEDAARYSPGSGDPLGAFQGAVVRNDHHPRQNPFLVCLFARHSKVQPIAGVVFHHQQDTGIVLHRCRRGPDRSQDAGNAGGGEDPPADGTGQHALADPSRMAGFVPAASSRQELNGCSVVGGFSCQDHVVVLKFLEAIRVLQEQSGNEFADRLFRVVENLFGFRHGSNDKKMFFFLVAAKRPRICAFILVESIFKSMFDAVWGFSHDRMQFEVGSC
mmetsp:Transcript_119227/g.243887  ORF Transcript_119227/g.243887 Transcript_119227/m.243887 type:complete len:509 (-) Transcript_119227:3-1529(-)